MVLFILFFTISLSMVGLFLFLLFRRIVKENKKYKQFADYYGYNYDKAQGQLSYRESSKTNQTEMIINLKLFKNPFVEKYANYNTYPFGRGGNIKVSYVISGSYEGIDFRAFTYIFTGSLLEKTGKGGVFSIVMVKCEQEPVNELPNNTFFEGSTLCNYLQGNLETDTIHSRILELNDYSYST